MQHRGLVEESCRLTRGGCARTEEATIHSFHHIQVPPTTTQSTSRQAKYLHHPTNHPLALLESPSLVRSPYSFPPAYHSRMWEKDTWTRFSALALHKWDRDDRLREHIPISVCPAQFSSPPGRPLPSSSTEGTHTPAEVVLRSWFIPNDVANETSRTTPGKANVAGWYARMDSLGRCKRSAKRGVTLCPSGEDTFVSVPIAENLV